MIGNRALYLRRRAANSVFLVLSVGAAVFGLIWLGFILGALLSEGVAAPVAASCSRNRRRRPAWMAVLPTPSWAAW